MKILLVDDESLQLRRLEESVRSVLPDAEVFSFLNPLEALATGKDMDIDVAFLDIEMPIHNGIMLAKELKAVHPTVNVIFVTAYDSFAREAMRIHASGYITKPVSPAKIKAEIEGLRFPVEMPSTKKVRIQCFGNFEVYCDGVPLQFSYRKSKELLAYLVDREGAVINMNELNAVLWEEDHPSYLRNLISDIQKSLKEVGAGDIFAKRHNGCFLKIDEVDCDAYEYKKGNPNAIRMYRGEYMIQYPWAVFKAN